MSDLLITHSIRVWMAFKLLITFSLIKMFIVVNVISREKYLWQGLYYIELNTVSKFSPKNFHLYTNCYNNLWYKDKLNV